MLKIEPTGKTLGARITGLDLARPLADGDLREIILALSNHGVVHFPAQRLDSPQIKALSECFGKVQFSSLAAEEEVPGVGILSNIVENGKALGKPDAGLMWHTEMSYNNPQGYVNVLYAVIVPHRDGQPLGGTEFINARAAYDDLPGDIKRRLAGLTAVHDVRNYWDRARAMGSSRPAFTPEHRDRKPLVVYPLVMRHTADGHEFLYCNTGFTVRINELPPEESEALLTFLFEHQLKPEFRHLHTWTVGDLLIWDNFGTQHRAIADYGADEHRLMKRCQVLSDKIHDPAFRARVLQAAQHETMAGA